MMRNCIHWDDGCVKGLYGGSPSVGVCLSACKSREPRILPRRLILRSGLCPGDIVMMTAAVRDLHAAYPGEYVTDVRTPCPALWEHNPNITKLADEDGEQIEMHYPAIGNSNQLPYHFIHGYRMHLETVLGRSIPQGAFKGDIYLSPQERSWPSQVEDALGAGTRFWIIVSGGKRDFTAKWWAASRMQAVVEHFRGRILFVQVGEAHHNHPALDGALDLRGQTSLRQLVRLVHHADGVVCPVTSLMHLAAAVPRRSGSALRPCVVIAGGREPAQWEQYPGHRFLDTIGQLACCATGGCWKSRVQALGDGDEKDKSLCTQPVAVGGRVILPRCMDMITVEDVVRAVQSYSHMEEPQTCCGMAGNALKAMGRAAVAVVKGAPLLVSKELKEQRLSVCRVCPSFENGRCLKCGCYTEIKAALATERCPDARWADAIPTLEFADAISTLELADAPVTFETSEARMDAFIRTMGKCPVTYAGRGIVICGGGEKYFTCAWVCINMLRRMGCRLPVQLWHLGPKEMDGKAAALAGLGVECVDALEVRKEHPARILNGWEIKAYAMLHSPFQEVLLLDADNVPLVNPEFLFDTPEYVETGAIFWPDLGRLAKDRPIWALCGVAYRDEPEFESGQIVVDKGRCWREMRLAMWMNEHSDFYYSHIHGDKETFHMAWRKTGRAYTMPARLHEIEGTLCQHDFTGRRIFQHRNCVKWNLFAENRRVQGFVFEDECLAYLDDLRTLLGLRKVAEPLDARYHRPPGPGKPVDDLRTLLGLPKVSNLWNRAALKPACIVQAHTDAGLFSIINNVITCMGFYDHVHADWVGTLYSTREQGNLWDTLFAPIARPDTSEIVNGYFDDRITWRHAGKIYRSTGDWRAQLHTLWKRLAVHEKFTAAASAFAEENWQGRDVVGMMVRSDTHASEQETERIQTLEDYAAAYERIRRPDTILHVMAMDEETLRWMGERFQTVCYYPNTKRTGLRSDPLPHLKNQTPQDAIDCLVEVLIIARARALIHPVSNMATAALYINPELESVYLE